MPGTVLGGSAPSMQTTSPETVGTLRRKTSIDVDGKAIGESPPFQYLQNRLAKIRREAGNVIITDEHGVGKELAARALRKRSGTPLVDPFEVNTLALPCRHGGILLRRDRGYDSVIAVTQESVFLCDQSTTQLTRSRAMPASMVSHRAESAQALLPFPLNSRFSSSPAATEVSVLRPTPFLKWAGGKRRLLAEIFSRFPERFGRYYEPFVGGGAIFFGLSPAYSVLSDVNAELINAYTALRDDVHGVIARLRRHVPTEDHFYSVRSRRAEELTPTEAAARMIFLNRTCFNGLYRVNRRGEFNVPFGRYSNPTICNTPNLLAVSRALRGVQLRSQCVFTIEDTINPGDLVYFDPPYDPVSTTASFVGYTRGGFGRDEQVKLSEMFARLAYRGVNVVLSNADTAFVRSLYRSFRIDSVTARRAINSRPDRRGPVTELIISTV